METIPFQQTVYHNSFKSIAFEAVKRTIAEEYEIFLKGAPERDARRKAEKQEADAQNPKHKDFKRLRFDDLIINKAHLRIVKRPQDFPTIEAWTAYACDIIEQICKETADLLGHRYNYLRNPTRFVGSGPVPEGTTYLAYAHFDEHSKLMTILANGDWIYSHTFITITPLFTGITIAHKINTLCHEYVHAKTHDMSHGSFFQSAAVFPFGVGPLNHTSDVRPVDYIGGSKIKFNNWFASKNTHHITHDFL